MGPPVHGDLVKVDKGLSVSGSNDRASGPVSVSPVSPRPSGTGVPWLMLESRFLGSPEERALVTSEEKE